MFSTFGTKTKESFIGFTIDGVHSSELGLIRTINGKMPLTQSGFNDVISPRVGADGEFWYGTTFTKKDIPIDFAYEGITEQQLSQIKRLFNSKKLTPLVLDEEPYKIWMVKPSQNATISNVCFGASGQRLYSGEGKVIFTSQVPYARCPVLCREDFGLDEDDRFAARFNEDSGDFGAEYLQVDNNNTNYLVGLQYCFIPHNNYREWREAAQLPSMNEQFVYADDTLTVKNVGDIPVGFKIYFNALDCQGGLTFKNQISDLEQPENNIELPARTYSSGNYICIDFYQKMVYGCDDNLNKNTNANYNKFLSKDTFGTLAVGTNTFQCTVEPIGLEMYYLFF